MSAEQLESVVTNSVSGQSSTYDRKRKHASLYKPDVTSQQQTEQSKATEGSDAETVPQSEMPNEFTEEKQSGKNVTNYLLTVKRRQSARATSLKQTASLAANKNVGNGMQSGGRGVNNRGNRTRGHKKATLSDDDEDDEDTTMDATNGNVNNNNGDLDEDYQSSSDENDATLENNEDHSNSENEDLVYCSECHVRCVESDIGDGNLLCQDCRDKADPTVKSTKPRRADVNCERRLPYPSRIRRSPPGGQENTVVLRPKRQVTVKAAKRTTEGKTTMSKINVGPQHQTPTVPYNFLEATEYGVNYGIVEAARRCQRATAAVRNGLPFNECHIVYSPRMWKNSVLKELAGNQNHTRDTAVCDDNIESSIIDSAFECRFSEHYDDSKDELIERQLQLYLEQIEKHWPSVVQWSFCTEFALSLLHYSAYDTQLAIENLENPTFNFQKACDPPKRPYMNKWRPKDRRGQIPSFPFPTTAPFSSRYRH